MSKNKVLGVISTLLSVFYVYILATSTYSADAFSSPITFIQAYTPNLILLFSFFLNSFIGYKLLFGKSKKLPFYLYLTLTFSTVFWFLLLFVGFFYASNIIFLAVSAVLVIMVFFLLHKTSERTALFLSLMTLFVSAVVIASSFEEDYCWKKGLEADSSGSKMISATPEDVQKLQGYDVKEGAQIGVSFRAHMLCHSSFNFTEALKEKFVLFK